MAESGPVTVLFTGLVGPTELSERSGDDAADDQRRQHFESLRSTPEQTVSGGRGRSRRRGGR